MAAVGLPGKVIFLSLPSAEVAVQRVAERVKQGGHGIVAPTIRRRFDTGKQLFDEVYKPLVDLWALYGNAGDIPLLMDWSENS